MFKILYTLNISNGNTSKTDNLVPKFYKSNVNITEKNLITTLRDNYFKLNMLYGKSLELLNREFYKKIL